MKGANFRGKLASASLKLGCGGRRMNAIRILNSVKLLTTKEQKKAPDCEGLVPIYGLPAKH